MDSGVVKKAIDHLNDMRQLFRENPDWLIDTLDVAIKCCKKQTAIEPEIGHRLDGEPMPVCPNCGQYVDSSYCKYCGQKINWHKSWHSCI